MMPRDPAHGSPGRVAPWAGRLSRKLGGLLYGAYAWTLLLLIVPPAFAVIALLRDMTARRTVARGAARLFFRCAGVRIRVSGLENLPVTPHVLLVNHTSFVDAIALAALLPARRGYAFTARQQHRAQSVFCPLLRSLGAVVLHPHDAHHASNIRLFTVTLARGKNLVIFPEGGIRPEPGLNAFHHGAFVAAAQAEVQVVVAALRGTRQALRLGTWLPRRTPIALEIGAAFMPEGKDAASIARLQDMARKAMLPLTGEDDLSACKVSE